MKWFYDILSSFFALWHLFMFGAVILVVVLVGAKILFQDWCDKQKGA